MQREGFGAREGDTPESRFRIPRGPVSWGAGGWLLPGGRLPAALCRAAWGLDDGEVTGPVESPYGLHFIKRVSYAQPRAFLLTDKTEGQVRDTRRQDLQEGLLYQLRERAPVQLRY